MSDAATTDAPSIQPGFWRNAAADPDRCALVCIDADLNETGRHTAGEVLALANRTAHGLRALGLAKESTVAVVLPNAVDLMGVYLGCLQVGMRITPINHHLVGPEIAYIVNDSEAAVFIGHERFTEALTAAAGEISVPAAHRFAVGTIEGFRPLAELTDGQPDTAPEDRTTGAAMHYTSGTTGKPKGVKRALFDLDPDVMAELLCGFQSLFNVQPGNNGVHLAASPLYHTAPLMWCGNGFHMGHKVVMMDRWEPRRMMELIRDERITWSHMVPTQFHRLLQAVPAEERAGWDVSSLQAMVHAAAPCPPEIKRQMIDWWGDAVWEYYAATEGGGTVITSKEWLEKPGSVGTAWPGSEIRVYDDDLNLLPAGTAGTVYMSLALADFEYKGDAGKTKANRHDGFFTVGDYGMLDEDGYLFLLDRKSDMIISGGVNIYPAEIEAAVIGAPGVDDVAVFGIPHDDWGEEIKAVVSPADRSILGDTAAEDAFRAGVFAHLNANLAKFKHPRTVDLQAELPRDPSGKLYKRKLRDPYWEGRDRAI